jgi:hypothetical protein
MDTSTIFKFSHYLPTCLWRWNSVPKRRHIKFRRRGITQKKTYNTKAEICEVATGTLSANLYNQATQTIFPTFVCPTAGATPPSDLTSILCLIRLCLQQILCCYKLCYGLTQSTNYTSYRVGLSIGKHVFVCVRFISATNCILSAL